MTAVYLGLAALAALGAGLVHFGVMPGFSGLTWLRVHLVTLGLLAQMLFVARGAPVSASHARSRRDRRRMGWLAFHGGLVLLLVGVPLADPLIMTAAGTLVFSGVVWLLLRLVGAPGAMAGRACYVAGLIFLLLGVVVGTGLWQGWGDGLRMAGPRELHIHANVWGFASLALAGALIDLSSRAVGHRVATARESSTACWILTAAATVLVLGPWIDLTRVIAPGLMLLLLMTAWLLARVVWPLARAGGAWTPGGVHLVAGYSWILVSALAVPVVMLRGGGRSTAAGLEQSAPQFLIYAWVLQIVFALMPVIQWKPSDAERTPRFGGTWLSVVAAQIGAVAFAASFAFPTAWATLQGAAYAVGMIAVIAQIPRHAGGLVSGS
jgi:hypothetical protein